MNSKSKSDRYLLVSSVCSLLAAGCIYALAASPMKNIVGAWFGQVNVISLVIGLCLFMLFMFVGTRLSNRWDGSVSIPFAGAVAFALVAANAFFLLRSFNEQPNLYDSHIHATFLFRYPAVVRFLLVGSLCAFFLLFLRKHVLLGKTLDKQDGKFYTAFSLLLTLVTAVSKYMPNVLNVSSGNLYHFHAYFNSIYNVTSGVPFSENMTSIYGHYALFFAPLLHLGKFFGFINEVKLTVIILAMLQGIIVLLYAWILSVFVKENWIRLLGLLSVCVANLSMDTSLYVQMQPHRTVVYAILAALITQWYRVPKKRGQLCVLGYAVSTLLIIWSTECGMIATVAWTALYCCDALQKPGIASWGKATGYLLCCSACFGAAVGLTDGFNCMLGGSPLTLREFVFPLLTGNYMEGYLEQQLYAGASGWISIVFVLFVFVGRGLSHTSPFAATPCKDERGSVYCALGALGIGTLTYAFNRPAFGNFYIMMPIMAVLLCIIVEHTKQDSEKFLSVEKSETPNFCRTLRGGVGCTTLCVLFLLSTFCVANYGSVQYQTQPLRDEYSMEYMSAVIQQSLAQDLETVAMGHGALELYAASDRDTGTHVMDYSDITIDPAHLAYADSVLGSLDGKALFICTKSMDVHREDNGEGYRTFMREHDLAATIVPPSEVSDLVFEYYVPKGYAFSQETLVLPQI